MEQVDILALRKSLKMNQKNFGSVIGIAQSYLSEIENGKKPLTEEVYHNLISVFGKDTISAHLKKSDNIATVRNEAIPLHPEHIIYVPLVNQYAYAGYLTGYADAEYIDTLPTIPFIVDQEAHGRYVAFEVRGDSMDDGTNEAIMDGDRLLCREIQMHLWADSKLHIRKWDFVIVHREGILVKRILEHNVANRTITIHSLNPFYPDREISLCEVMQIFNVIEYTRPRRR